MRINKFISSSGFCSRREAERLIRAGKITVNGEIPEQNYMITPTDVVLIEGKPLPVKKRLIYIALNKPVGVVCTNATTVKNNIADYMHFPERIFAVGRLDKDSEGLLLLTNDGEIAHKILHSEHNHEKEYIVTVDKPITDDFIEKMANGVEIPNLNTVTKACKVYQINETTFRIILTQGLNRQIRRMCKELHYRVIRLQRIRIMNIKLTDLEYGMWRELTEQEINQLKSLLQ
ncbi:pseudouridine synthase [Schinkia sp. CFF1]